MVFVLAFNTKLEVGDDGPPFNCQPAAVVVPVGALVLVNTIKVGAQSLFVVYEKSALMGPICTNAALVMVCLQPNDEVISNSTVYTPTAVYVLLGLAEVEVVLSPNFHK
jgi:hypothetical protein